MYPAGPLVSTRGPSRPRPLPLPTRDGARAHLGKLLPPRRKPRTACARENTSEALRRTGLLLARRRGLGCVQGVPWAAGGGWLAGWSTGLRWAQLSVSHARAGSDLSRLLPLQ